MKIMEREKTHYDFIFIILVYKNYYDLQDFLKSQHNIDGAFKNVVVNSYCDRESEARIENVSNDNGCDFLSIPNKGYSFGNNVGVKHAVENYNFDYLIVSNPDIIIASIDFKSFSDYKNVIIGPNIYCRNGKNQNPVYYNEKDKVIKFFQMLSIKTKIFDFIYFASVYNKIQKLIKKVSLGKKNSFIEVYALHGSFLIFSYGALEKLNFHPFDEEMFLFAEEDLLALKAKYFNIKMIFNRNNSVFHKEDGSIKISSINKKKVALQSLEYLYKYENN